MDWLRARQEMIEGKLARRHLAPEPNPRRMALFGLPSSWLEGLHCPLGARGYSRDGKKGKVQIEYGLLTGPGGRPVAIRVFEGNTADPAAFTAIADVVHGTFGLKRMVMAGDRGMITSARIKALKEPGEKYAWITAPRSPRIRALMAGDGPLQLSLFDEQDLAEITSPASPASGSSPAATPPSQASAPATARPSWPPPISSLPPSPPASPQGVSPGSAVQGAAR